MHSNIQIVSLLFSFLFGIIFYYLTRVNYKLIENLRKLYANIITIVFTLDMVLIYSVLIYRINNGYYHIYFLSLVLLGFLLALLYSQKYSTKSKTNVKRKKRP